MVQSNLFSIAPVIAAGLLFATLSSGSNAADPEAYPIGNTQKVTGTPHFYQSDPRGQFPEKGQNYCSPTAVSDSFVYLAAHGFPKLLPAGIADPTEAQIAMIKTLASPNYMKTDPASGTGPGQTYTGIQRYVEAFGYACKTIEYRGWRAMPKSANAPPTSISLDWIKKNAADPHGAAWVNIGWYVAGTTPDEWKRVGGHWVAVVGFGVDGTGHENPDILLIDNPAVPANSTDAINKASSLAVGTAAPTDEQIAANVMTAIPTKQGRLVGPEPGLPRDAAGIYRLSGQGVHLSKKYDAAFLDAAIVLVIGDPPAPASPR